MTVRLLRGDCVVRMAEMPDGSVDAVVVDPPYGLEFMGKEWDRIEPGRLRQRWAGTERANLFSEPGGMFGGLPSIRPGRNRRCRKCGRYAFSGTPCRCPDPDWDLRGAEHAEFMQTWHAEWLTEAHRVLRSGGIAKVMGATRTFHRVAAAMADVGFADIRVEAWAYGSGFPKSLDVSKAIDRRRHDVDRVLTVTRWVHAAFQASGRSRAEVLAGFDFVGDGMLSHWSAVSVGGQPQTPRADQWPTLVAGLGLSPADVPPEIDRLVAELNAAKGTPGEAWFRREVLAERTLTQGGAMIGIFSQGPRREVDAPITAPATAESQAWDGWGTALKPAWEPVIVGRRL